MKFNRKYVGLIPQTKQGVCLRPFQCWGMDVYVHFKD